MARKERTTGAKSSQAIARETLRRLITRKKLTHDDEVRGSHAGLYLIALALEELAAQGIDTEREAIASSSTHALWTCTDCRWLAPLKFESKQTMRDCPNCGTVGTLHPLPPAAKGER